MNSTASYLFVFCSLSAAATNLAVATANDVQTSHWSFQTPTQPLLPQTDQVNPDWASGPIDRFILAKMKEKGLAPSPKADAHTLIRRLSFDLTGLPPEVAEVREFAANNSLEAYEKLVDKFIDQDSFGEHRARYWLDVVRYGDTHGLHVDNYREMWPYRDWVIAAFNQNLPYDEFLLQQLAGDLLPNASLSEMVATGFTRCHVSTNEGGSIAEEVHVRNVVDRVSTFGTAYLGMTLGCAVCHDHKYDPISQKDFYQLFAFFNVLDGPPMDGNVRNHAPMVYVPTEMQGQQLEDLEVAIKSVRDRQQERLRSFSPDADFESWAADRLKLAQSNQADPELQLDEDLLVQCNFNESGGATFVNSAVTDSSGSIEGTLDRAAGLDRGGLVCSETTYGNLGRICKFDSDEPLSMGAWVRVGGDESGAVLSKVEVKNLQRGYELAINGRRLVAFLNARWPGYGLKLRTTAEVLKPHSWHHVFVTYDGKKEAWGVKIYVDGEPQPLTILCDSLRNEGSFDAKCALLLGRREGEAILKDTILDDVHIYKRCLSERDVQLLMQLTHLNAQLAAIFPSETEPLWRLLQDHYVRQHDSEYLELASNLESLLDRQRDLMLQVPTTLVFRETIKPRQAHVLIRGEYNQLGEPVERRTPGFLPAMADDLPLDRRGLGEWLRSPEHPLTARVAVNQIWQQFFGTGLVKTSEDFGTQGEAPTHPELLDWLAVRFREDGWDVKRLVKEIVMSSAYRQSSHTTPDTLAIDPENSWLSRGPRHRFDAEVLRDQALAVSGLLVRQLGGPSVKPPQPGGLWKAVAILDSNTRKFEADREPEKIYRRSLYTFWKRTAPPPQMSTFDAPSRESCIVRRERTNTPLQALLLMNEPQYVEAAKNLAKRALSESLGEPADRTAWMFEQVTMRQPNSRELNELAKTYQAFQKHYDANQNAAAEFLASEKTDESTTQEQRELAAWTLMANLMLNLDEAVTKE